MGTAPENVIAQVLERYDQRIAYYWKTGDHNKRSYKTMRCLLIILGALLTLVSSLSSATFVKGDLAIVFAVVTPVLAAGMAILGGVSQAFQWGAAWADSVMAAMRLEKERDRIAGTLPVAVDPFKELALLDDAVMAETQSFFHHVLGFRGSTKPVSGPPAG